MQTESYSLELLREVGIPSEECYLSIGWKADVPRLEDDVCVPHETIARHFQGVQGSNYFVCR